MGATITPGNFVRKSGDTMTGQLRMLGSGVGYGILLESLGGWKTFLSPSSSKDHVLMISNEAQTVYGEAYVNRIQFSDSGAVRAILKAGAVADRLDLRNNNDTGLGNLLRAACI